MNCEITIFDGGSALCPHPPLTNCSECRIEVCSEHVVDCEVCEHFICKDCEPEHLRQHQRAERRIH